MKLLIFAARLMLGLLFTVFGLNHLFGNFLHLPMLPGDAGVMMTLMFVHKWFLLYGLIEAAAGLMLLVGRWVPLGLTLLAGIIVNITLFSATLALPGLKIAIFAGLLELLLVYAYRGSFAGIFASKASPTLT
jgi:putative oxidoreductase